jgi:dihydroxyacetone kinase-like predicted kinase
MGVLEEGLLKAELPEGGVVTLYRGGEITELEAQTAAERLRAVLPGQEVEVVYGGQPFYHYIASIE